MCTDKYSYLVRYIGAMRLLREIRQIVGNPSVRYNNERGVFMKHWSNALLLGCPKNDICHLWLHHSPSWYASQLRSFSWASMNKQRNFCESEVAAKKTRNISLVSIMKQIPLRKSEQRTVISYKNWRTMWSSWTRFVHVISSTIISLYK